MTAGELARVIGASGTVRVSPGSDQGWPVPCEIVDARQVWGKTQYQVRPVGFDGVAVWVESARVTVTK